MLTLSTHPRPSRDLVEDVRRQFDWFFGADPFGLFPSRISTAPRFFAERTEAGLEVKADLPGLTAEQLDVEFEDGRVKVVGEWGSTEREGYRTLRKERTTGRFERSFSLPTDVDASAATAELAQGVLTLRFPLRPEKQPRQIEVKAG